MPRNSYSYANSKPRPPISSDKRYMPSRPSRRKSQQELMESRYIEDLRALQASPQRGPLSSAVIRSKLKHENSTS